MAFLTRRSLLPLAQPLQEGEFTVVADSNISKQHLVLIQSLSLKAEPVGFPYIPPADQALHALPGLRMSPQNKAQFILFSKLFPLGK